MTPISAIAAGAAAGAARDAGADEQGQLQQGTMAALVAERAADRVEPSCPPAPKGDKPAAREEKQAGDSFLRRLAHFLGLM